MSLLVFNTLLLLVLIALQQLVVVRDRRAAVRVAAAVAEAATVAAREATQAAFIVNLALDRSQALYSEIEAQIGKILQATIRMEAASAVIAANLAAAQTVANHTIAAKDYEPGQAADQYAAHRTSKD